MAERAAVTLSLPEVDKMIRDIEARGGDASELKKLRAQVADAKWLKKAEAAKPLSEEEHIAELRSKSPVEHGTDLECMVCHKKVDTLVSGTCEVCFREWALTMKRRLVR